MGGGGLRARPRCMQRIQGPPLQNVGPSFQTRAQAQVLLRPTHHIPWPSSVARPMRHTYLGATTRSRARAAPPSPCSTYLHHYYYLTVVTEHVRARARSALWSSVGHLPVLIPEKNQSGGPKESKVVSIPQIPVSPKYSCNGRGPGDLGGGQGVGVHQSAASLGVGGQGLDLSTGTQQTCATMQHCCLCVTAPQWLDTMFTCGPQHRPLNL